MFETAKSLCASFLKMGVPGFDLLVYKDGKEIFRHMGGYSDLAKKTPMRGDEKYNIFSCSKPITCTAAMQLWDKGLFSLDDELSKYMPEFENMMVRTEEGLEPAKRPIRIHHLFEMTAGFSYDLRSPQLEQLRIDTEGRCPTREVARYLAREPLHFHPGDKFLYSLCHDVLAALVEVISGQKFECYVKEHIFEPLGMKDSDFLLPMDQYDTVSTMHVFDAQIGGTRATSSQVPMYRLGSEHASGGAGCVSTVADYMKFLEALREGQRLLKRETIELMATDRLNDEQKRGYASRRVYGYGLGMRTPKVGSCRTDFGWGGAAGAHLVVDIPHGLSMFYVQHELLAPNMDIKHRVYLSIVDDLAGTKMLEEDIQATGNAVLDQTVTF